MKKIDRHIYFPIDLHKRLSDISEEKNTPYTYLVEDLVRIGIDEIDKSKRIEEIEATLIYIKNKVNLTFELLMQIYADMDFDNIKDIKNSIALKKFFRKRKDLNYDD